MTEEKIAERYTYRITWSEADLSHVGTCHEFPSLSWLAESPESAFTGIRRLVRGCVSDMIATGEVCPTADNASQSDGLVQLRISAERHRQLAILAAEQGIGVEDLVCNCLIASFPVNAFSHHSIGVLSMNAAPPDRPPMAAIAARYDHRIGQVMIKLRCGLLLAFRPRDIQGLEAAKKADLKDIEISPCGLGIHFPSLDADIHIPSLIQGHLGSQQWLMSRQENESR